MNNNTVKEGTSSATETPWNRLQRALRFATQRIQPGDEVPEAPPELQEWGQNTALAMFAGICFMGARQWVQHRRLGPYRPQQPGLSKAQEARLIAEENTRRLLRLSSQAIKGGLQFGSLAGLFYGVQMVSGIANGERSLGDTVLASAVTGGVFGSFLPGGVLLKLRSCVLGAALGASAGFPVGFLQQQVDASIIQRPSDSDPTSKEQQSGDPAGPKRRYPELQGNPAEAVIRQLEGGIRK